MFFWPSVFAGWLGLALIPTGIGILFFMGAQADIETFLAGAIFFLTGLCVPSFIWWIAKKTYETSTFVITNRRVTIKTGFLSKRQCQMNINKIEGIDMSQTFFDRMIDCGSVTIRGTGGTREVFGRIAKPAEFQDRLQSQLDLMIPA